MSGPYITLQQTGDPKLEVIREVRNPCRKYVVWTMWGLVSSTVVLAAVLAFSGASSILRAIDGDAARVSYEVGDRRKREVGVEEGVEDRKKAEEAIMRLIREPACSREDCERLEEQLKSLGSSIDSIMAGLAALKKEIEKVSRGCSGNRTGEEQDSSEVQLGISHHHRQGGELEDGQYPNERIVDHDLAASAMQEVRYPPPSGYPWPPAIPGGGRKHGIPPTGPDSPGLSGGLEPTGSGPGETIHTSQQMTVSLPQQLQRVCSMVPGPPGSSGYLCTPVRDLMSQQQPPNSDFYLQVVGRSHQTHVPTAISTPNPYAFPTLSGSPVIVPASAAAPGQLMPVYNPSDGKIQLQNYQQSVPGLSQQGLQQVHPHQQQFITTSPQHQQQFPSAIPPQQHFSSFLPQQQHLPTTFQQQFPSILPQQFQSSFPQQQQFQGDFPQHQQFQGNFPQHQLFQSSHPQQQQFQGSHPQQQQFQGSHLQQQHFQGNLPQQQQFQGSFPQQQQFQGSRPQQQHFPAAMPQQQQFPTSTKPQQQQLTGYQQQSLANPFQQYFIPQSGFTVGQTQYQNYKPQLTVPQFGPPSLPPQVFIPQPANQPSSELLQCAYVIVPNSPVQTYKFPPVTGVSETLQRSGHSPKKAGHNRKKINQDKVLKLEENHIKYLKGIKDVNKMNSTSPKMDGFGGNCELGFRVCADGINCVEIDDWCDSKLDCPDRSDEEFCSCMDRMLTEKLCDGYFDCPRGEDELGCTGCEESMFSCLDADEEHPIATCLPLERRCDFEKDCRNGMDEVECSLISDMHHVNEVSVVSFSEGFLFRNWKGIWYPVCTSTSWLLEACTTEIGPLNGVPQIKLGKLHKYEGLVANETPLGLELTDICGLSNQAGTALWVDCPQPECGIKKRSKDNHRVKRQLPQNPSDHDPTFQTAPEAMDFVKNFFDTASVFDRRKFYKRLWGPLTQPYMGIQETGQKEDQVAYAPDSTQSSWKHYLRPYHRTVESFDPSNFFPNYQDLIRYEGLTPYDLVPVDSYNYQNYPENYLQDYMMPYYSPNYIRHQRNIPDEEERLKREEVLRVVGGSRSRPGDWPWVVLLYRNGDFHCGGTVLTNSVVLTAAHCVHDFEKYYYEVRAGLLRRYSFSPQEQIRAVGEVVAHEDYDRNTMMNDVALLRLVSPFKYNRWVRPACLPPNVEPGQPELPQPGTYCTTIGWGAIYEGGPDPDSLREVEVPILPSCVHVVDQRGNEICAGYLEGGMDTCQGDSGGPLLCRSDKNKWYIAGIVSHGQGCARLGEPGVYTKVLIFKKWIQDHLTWTTGTSKASRKSCPGPICKSGRCLSASSRCNSYIDCLDGEDEQDCLLTDPLLVERIASNGTTNQNHKGKAVAQNDSLTSAPRSNISDLNDTETLETRDVTEEYSTITNEGSTFDITKDITDEYPVATEETTVNPTTETATENKELHSQQIKHLDITHIFTCQRIHQRILLHLVCDGIVDCEDGSDEVGCSCRDKIKHLAPNLICNGITDCRDATDEADCPEMCHEDEFFCQKSVNCIPISDRCNMERDCYFGDDEEGCYALVEDELLKDKFDNPPYRISGTAAFFSNNTWKPVCVTSSSEAIALQVCESLGFRIVKDYNKFNSTLSKENKDSCVRLNISCTSPKNNLWMAPLYNSGSPQTLAVLMSKDWLLAPTAGLRFQESKTYLNTWLGKANLSLNIDGVHDEYIRIDGVSTLGDGHVTLLHLEKPASIKNLVVPLQFPDWPTPPKENEKCEAVGMTLNGDITSLELIPVACKEGTRCYRRSKDNNPNICGLTGAVLCYSEYGSYLTSVVSGDLCIVPLIELHDITKDRQTILEHIKTGNYEVLEENICESVRCETGQCLGWEKIGDGIKDCFNSWDESAEAWHRKEEHCEEHGENCSCRPGEFRCRGGACIDSKKFCDGTTDCSDTSDETECDCRAYLSLAKPHQLCNGIQNCMDKGDESWEYCSNKSDCSTPGRFSCQVSGGCIPSSFVCDGDNDCPHGEDEEKCIVIRSPLNREKEGLLYSRVYGLMVPQCLDSDKGLSKIICSLLGDGEVLSSSLSQVPLSYILTDVFSKVEFNKGTSLALRSNRPFATVQQTNTTCSALYVQCK